MKIIVEQQKNILEDLLFRQLYNSSRAVDLHKNYDFLILMTIKELFY